ncbi:MAG: protein-disulfide reductase DsbD family protein [Vicinamibacterales bacterium]
MNLRSPKPFSLRFAALLLVAATVGAHSAAAQQGPPQPVTWSLALEPAPGHATAGGRLIAVLTAAIDEGWHVYAPDEANVGPRPVELTVVKNPVFSAAGKLEAPEPEREMDEAFGQITASYTGEATFRLPVGVAASAAAGPHALEIDVSFQACNGSICLPAKNVRVKAAVTVK